MDMLSRLIDLSRLQPALDIRCRLEGAFHIDHEATARGSVPFHLVLGGNCRIRTSAGHGVFMRSGDFVLLPRGAAHAIIGTEDGGPAAPFKVTHEGMLPLRQNAPAETADVDLLCGHFDCAWGSSTLLLDTLPDVFQASLIGAQSEETLKMLVSLLREETAQEQPGARTIVTAMCLALFTMALRSRGAASLGTPGLLPLLANPRLVKSVKAVMADPAHGWTIDELADLSAMSRATYARQFKESAAMTVGTFLTDLRMMLASDLLLRTRRTVADIAAEVGYESEAAFGKAFKAGKGLTPARFRQQFS
ncbi:AraC family transcriptional regulator [Rhizobium ruizarguesonis]|uniref:AraC family transcriptional regulator n=1 Tax=Rhizobium ruizarguesonis TaxID=2081791 RepID=UPI00037DB854|nr:AraC family transcriptional regulator [Rhizobium ruizarguesonis]TAY64129.1 AraC family transcriptional regulator [Rhizobium ruizarguesonis]